MKREDIRWVTIDREDLLDVLLGEQEPPNAGRPSYELEPLRSKLAIGIREAAQHQRFASPSLIVIADDAVPETLSWLRTFAEEASPLSQYARVILSSDWRQFEIRSGFPSSTAQRTDRWASIVVGEAISQVDGETELQSLPLSRLAGCFSTPVARSALIWGQEQATRTCADRLRLLEADRRFGRRPVSIEQLTPVWSIASVGVDGYLPPAEAATLVLEVASQHFRSSRDDVLTPLLLSEHPQLSSDSVEERVGAFNRLAEQLRQKATLTNRGTQQSAVASVAIAAAAFLVGRGTSHLFLLQRAQQWAPTAAAWYGAMAALAGPRAWDKAWLRAVKGAERLLRPEFRWCEPSGADICWVELAWLIKTFEGQDIFLELPKMLPRTLSIEVVPGATCQFRIVGDSAEGIESKPVIVSGPSSGPSSREQALEDALSQFVALTKRASSLLPGKSTGTSEPAQKTFELEGDSAPEKPLRPRKPKRDTRRT